MDKKEKGPPKFPEIGKRLALFIERSGEPSDRQFALKAKLKPQIISHLAAGYSMPSSETLIALATAYKDFDANWLLTGKGAAPADQLPPVLPSKLEPQPTAPQGAPQPIMGITAEGEHYWRAVASERLRENEFLKELLRASNGLIRPSDDQDTDAAEPKKELTSSHAADLRQTVDAIAAEQSLPQRELGFWQKGRHLRVAFG